MATSSQQHIGIVHFRGVRVWNSRLKKLIDYPGLYYHGGEGQSDLEFSPDCERLWVTYRKGPHLRVWRMNDPEDEPFETIDLSEPAFQIAVSPDGKLLAIALYRHIVLLQASDYRRLACWSAPNGDDKMQSSVSGLSFSPDGRILTSTDVLGGVWLWPMGSVVGVLDSKGSI